MSLASAAVPRLVAALISLGAAGVAFSQPLGATKARPADQPQKINFALPSEPPLAVEQPWRQSQTRQASGTRRALRRSDELSPPGCLIRVGQPVGSFCEPCPPLWLGGASVFCVATPVSEPASVRARLTVCAGTPILLPTTALRKLEARLCGARF